MRKLPAIAMVGAIALGLAGTAVAASRNSHVMTVALPDGSTARVEYVGNVAPKVTIQPSSLAEFSGWAPIPPFAGFDRMIDQMNRQTQAMMREVQQAEQQPAAGMAAPYVASFGTAPASVTSTTIVSYSNGNQTCTRTTETIAQGPGKPPKVRSNLSGHCASQSAPAPAPGAPLNRA